MNEGKLIAGHHRSELEGNFDVGYPYSDFMEEYLNPPCTSENMDIMNERLCFEFMDNMRNAMTVYPHRYKVECLHKAFTRFEKYDIGTCLGYLDIINIKVDVTIGNEICLDICFEDMSKCLITFGMGYTEKLPVLHFIHRSVNEEIHRSNFDPAVIVIYVYNLEVQYDYHIHGNMQSKEKTELLRNRRDILKIATNV